RQTSLRCTIEGRARALTRRRAVDATRIALLTRADQTIAADRRTHARVRRVRRSALTGAVGIGRAVALLAELLHVVAALLRTRAIGLARAGAVRGVAAVTLLLRTVLHVVAAAGDGDARGQTQRTRPGEPGRLVDGLAGRRRN